MSQHSGEEMSTTSAEEMSEMSTTSSVKGAVTDSVPTLRLLCLSGSHIKEFMLNMSARSVHRVEIPCETTVTIVGDVDYWAGNGRYRKESQNPHRIFVVLRVSLLAQ